MCAWNWYTAAAQNRWPERDWGFDSLHMHQLSAGGQMAKAPRSERGDFVGSSPIPPTKIYGARLGANTAFEVVNESSILSAPANLEESHNGIAAGC